MRQILDAELFRLQSMSASENRLRDQGYDRIAGVDEAGRGPLAGPVVAVACILPPGLFFEHLNDSKKLKSEVREQLFSEITSEKDVLFAIGVADVPTIDRINILQATFLAMRNAVSALPSRPDYLLIDGNASPFVEIPNETMIQGDSLSLSIAAASILAKVTRDRMMQEFDQKWPQYGFGKHKGYATEEHIGAIQRLGPCPIHRKSFDPIRSLFFPDRQMQLFSDI